MEKKYYIGSVAIAFYAIFGIRGYVCRDSAGSILIIIFALHLRGFLDNFKLQLDPLRLYYYYQDKTMAGPAHKIYTHLIMTLYRIITSKIKTKRLG